MGWFLQLMEELGVSCYVGDPAKVRKVETRRQKHDRRDAALLLELLTENRFPSIWMPPPELRDLRALLRHRDQWVRMRAFVPVRRGLQLRPDLHLQGLPAPERAAVGGPVAHRWRNRRYEELEEALCHT